MKNILIIYGTREGQTEKIATQISAHLQTAGENVQLVNAKDKSATKNLDLAAFDVFVFGASMHAGGLEHELVNFINSHKEQIEVKARLFFLVLLSAATKDQKRRADSLKEAQKKLDQQLLVQFPDTEMIAGALMYSKYVLPIKWIMKIIAKKNGEGTDTSRDYEYTDWKQVERFSEKILKT